MTRCAAATLVLLIAPALAQEIDTTIQVERPRHQQTILDQMTLDEQRDFLKFYNAKDPSIRKTSAQEFIVHHPQSWFLAQAFEASAKASIALDDYEDAVKSARLSLRLYPENPLLLVPLANVEARMGKLPDTVRDARWALELLKDDAAAQARQLTASAHFAIARVYVAKQRPALYTEALAELDRAAQANPGDDEIRQLQQMVADALKTSRAIPVVQKQPSGDPGPYAGSEACRECHGTQYQSWQKTGMARMLRVYKAENVFGDFRQGTEFSDGAPVARFGSNGRPYMELRAQDGTWQRYYVDYTIGSKWQQAYVTRTDQGLMQVLPVQYNRLERRWLNYWKLIDPENSARANPRLFSRLTAETNYQLNCAVCHTSQLRAESGDVNAMEHASFRETGINCEMCHGPSKAHVDRMHGNVSDPGAAQYPLRFGKMNNRDAVAVCAQCHKQSAVHAPNRRGELNYSSRGETFIEKTSSRPTGDFLRAAFYKDGRFRQTTFIVEAFTRSRCYREGTAQCASCHDPHPNHAEQNPVSLKFRNDPDRMCTQCHAGISSRIEAHTHHAAASEASRCVSCHMPKIMDSLMFEARSHQIDDVPDAGMTSRFGQHDSPNACLLCHKDRDAGWVSSTMAGWKQ